MKSSKPSPEELLEAARGGDRAALARVLSLVERGNADARAVSAELTRYAGSTASPTMAERMAAYTVGVTGAPGAGKSTLVNALITILRNEGHRVAVLAVDPSSPYSGGAILGDRVRMGDHALDEGVYVRSMASRGHLGGLAVATPEAVRVLGAAGYPWVVVETVGVGQVEVEVASQTDTTLVVVNPGWGDAVQASKAGLMEIADVFVVNKADRPGAKETRRDLERMQGMAQSSGGWHPPVVLATATSGEGTQEVLGALQEHRRHLETTGGLEERRRRRASDEIARVVAATLAEKARSMTEGDEAAKLAEAVAGGQLDPWTAAQRLLTIR